MYQKFRRAVDATIVVTSIAYFKPFVKLTAIAVVNNGRKAKKLLDDALDPSKSLP